MLVDQILPREVGVILQICVVEDEDPISSGAEERIIAVGEEEGLICLEAAARAGEGIAMPTEDAVEDSPVQVGVVHTISHQTNTSKGLRMRILSQASQSPVIITKFHQQQEELRFSVGEERLVIPEEDAVEDSLFLLEAVCGVSCRMTMSRDLGMRILDQTVIIKLRRHGHHNLQQQEEKVTFLEELPDGEEETAMRNASKGRSRNFQLFTSGGVRRVMSGEEERRSEDQDPRPSSHHQAASSYAAAAIHPSNSGFYVNGRE
ncbi:MAG: hypothetical protein Q9169_001092 [Polycauliona sp. 2 TL-2023]